MSQRWSAIFCATGMWGGKPMRRVRINLVQTCYILTSFQMFIFLKHFLNILFKSDLGYWKIWRVRSKLPRAQESTSMIKLEFNIWSLNFTQVVTELLGKSTCPNFHEAKIQISKFLDFSIRNKIEWCSKNAKKWKVVQVISSATLSKPKINLISRFESSRI